MFGRTTWVTFDIRSPGLFCSAASVTWAECSRMRRAAKTLHRALHLIGLIAGDVRNAARSLRRGGRVAQLPDCSVASEIVTGGWRKADNSHRMCSPPVR